MKIIAIPICALVLAGCGGIAKKKPATDRPALEVGMTTLQEVEKIKGKPARYEGEAAEFGTVTWVYPDMKFHFKRGILQKIEDTGHNNHKEGAGE